MNINIYRYKYEYKYKYIKREGESQKRTVQASPGCTQMGIKWNPFRGQSTSRRRCRSLPKSSLAPAGCGLARNHGLWVLKPGIQTWSLALLSVLGGWVNSWFFWLKHTRDMGPFFGILLLKRTCLRSNVDGLVLLFAGHIWHWHIPCLSVKSRFLFQKIAVNAPKISVDSGFSILLLAWYPQGLVEIASTLVKTV